MGSASAGDPPGPKIKNPKVSKKILNRGKMKDAITENDGMGGSYFF